VLQPNFQYENAIFGRIGSSKGAAQKTQIMNYEQLFSLVFSWTKKQSKFFFKAIVASALKSW
jgi:hypothetical protein